VIHDGNFIQVGYKTLNMFPIQNQKKLKWKVNPLT
jgi:hypothetical protein